MIYTDANCREYKTGGHYSCCSPGFTTRSLFKSSPGVLELTVRAIHIDIENLGLVNLGSQRQEQQKLNWPNKIVRTSRHKTRKRVLLCCCCYCLATKC